MEVMDNIIVLTIWEKVENILTIGMTVKQELMSSHGENSSKEDKSWTGQRANETMTRGDWTRGVKN